MNALEFRQYIFAIRELRASLGESAGTELEEKTNLGKRQNRFERDVVEMTFRRFPHLNVQAESILPSWGERELKEGEFVLCLDQVDGTAGDVRTTGAKVQTGLPISSVVALREHRKNPTFASVIRAGLLDLRDDTIYLAGPEGADVIDKRGVRHLKRTPQYNRHVPMVAIENARRANAFHSFLIPYGVYGVVSDQYSSATNMLWSLMGCHDVWLNFNPPGLTGAGQRGHELSAMAVFARQLRACAYEIGAEGDQMTLLRPLDEATYTFDGQTSVIMGVDEGIVRHYLDLINTSLRKIVKIGGIEVSVLQVLQALMTTLPGERYNFPLVPDHA